MISPMGPCRETASQPQHHSFLQPCTDLRFTMASEFIGYTILVTLQTPRNAQVQGVVADVANHKLLLQNGMSDPWILSTP